jgi:16S rRNA C1402 (ribose-2'-O) methylase RsmI
MTKYHERVHRLTVAQATRQPELVLPRGEFTVVVAGPDPHEAAPAAAPDLPTLRAGFRALRTAGDGRAKALSALAADTGLPRKTLYSLLVAKRPASSTL